MVVRPLDEGVGKALIGHTEVFVESNAPPSSARGFRGSPRLRRFGSVVLGGFVIGYLMIITRAWTVGSISPWRLGVLVALWVVGLSAVVLLIRGYRHAKR